MTTRGRWGLGVLGGLLLAVALVVLLFDWNWLRGLIEARLEEQLGREVAIEGDLEGEFSLTPRVVAHDVVIANAEWGSEPHMLRVRRVGFVIDLWELWGGRLDLWDIAIDQPEVLVERSGEGEINWALGPEEEQPEEQPGPPPRIGAFAIENATIVYRGPQTERDVMLSLAQASGTGGRATEPVELQGEGTLADLPLALEFDAGALSRLQDDAEPYPLELALTAGESSLDVQGSIEGAAEPGRAEFQVRLDSPDPGPLLAAVDLLEQPRAPPLTASGRLVHERQVWAVTDLDVELGGSQIAGRLGVDLGQQPPFLKADLDSDRLQVGPLRAFVEDLLPLQPGLPDDDEPAEGAPELPNIAAEIEFTGRNIEAEDARLDELRMVAEIENRIPRVSLQGSGTLDDEPMTLNIRLGSEQAMRDASGPYPIEVALEANRTRLGLTGQLAEPLAFEGLELNVELRSPDPATLLELIGLPAPSLPGIELAGELSRQDDLWQIRYAAARVGESDIAGQASVDLSGPQPTIRADLRSNLLDLDDVEDLIGPRTRSTARDLQDDLGDSGEDAAEQDAQPILTGSGLNPNALPELDARIAYEVVRLEGDNFHLEDVNFEGRLANQIPRFVVTGGGAFRGDPIVLDVRLGELDGDQADGPYPVDLHVEVAQTLVDLSGQLQTPTSFEQLQGEFTIRTENAAHWLGLLDLPRPELPPFAAGGQLVREERSWQLSGLTLEVGESDLAGTLAFSLGEPKPSIQADLSSDYLQFNDVAALVDAVQEVREPLPTAEGLPVVSMEDWRPQFHPEALPDVDADITYAAQRFEGPDFALQEVAAELHMGEGLPSVALAGQGTALGESVAIDVALGGAGAGEAQDGAYPIEARISADQSRLELTGTIAQPSELEGLDLQFEIASPNPTQWLELVALPAPDLPQIQASGQLSQEGQSWRLPELYLEVGESNLFGEVSLDLSDPRPVIVADLQSNRLIAEDLQRLVPEGAEEDGEEAEEPERGLAALPEVDADLSLDAELVQAQELRLARLTADLRLREQILVLDLAGEGRFRDSPLTIEAQLGTEEVIEDPDAPYPVRVALVSEQTEAHAEGSVGEPLGFTELDVAVSLEGEDLEQFGDILQIGLPSTPPYRLRGNLGHRDARWTLANLDGRIADSDIGGEVTVDLAGERPMIVADLRSDQLDFDDLGPLVGAPPGTEGQDTASPEQEQEAAIEATEPGVLPEREIDVPQLRAFDARIEYVAANVQAERFPLEEVAVQMRLEDGVLEVAPLRFDTAGGAIEAELGLNANQDPIAVSADVRVADVDFDDVLRTFEIELPEVEDPGGVGVLSGRADLGARGNSVAEIAGSLDGRAAVIMEGGRINATIIEAIGLDLAEVIGLFMADDEDETVPVRCLVSSFEITDGTIAVETLILDTTDSVIVGDGTIDLGAETLNLSLEAHPKDPSFPTASTPVEIGGTFGDVQVSPAETPLIAKGLAAVGLGFLLPVVGAVIPFIEPGLAEDSNCRALIQQAEQSGPPEAEPQVGD